jgi:kynurenine--oxoglutarate transaminase/cysteine-S-conjugate beta-lyase/glutamine--phenylpyruvate transaminase
VEPFFDCYEPLVKLAGGTPKFISLKPSNPTDETSASWKLNLEELRSLFSDKTKAIILNTPNNPLGMYKNSVVIVLEVELTVVEVYVDL